MEGVGNRAHVYFPFWWLAICWLFVQGPRAAKGEGLSNCQRVDGPHLPSTGSCFLRTDQLDGETDWKLRLPVACTQRLPTASVSSFPCPGTDWPRPWPWPGSQTQVSSGARHGRSKVKWGCWGVLGSWGALSPGQFQVLWSCEART